MCKQDTESGAWRCAKYNRGNLEGTHLTRFSPGGLSSGEGVIFVQRSIVCIDTGYNPDGYTLTYYLDLDLDRPIPGRRSSAGRQDSRSTTPAVIVDVGIGRPVYTTVHCRRPSVSRRRGTNMQQFESRSDIIKFHANLQNQTKITFILGVQFHSFRIVMVFVQCLKFFGTFFTINLM